MTDMQKQIAEILKQQHQTQQMVIELNKKLGGDSDLDFYEEAPERARSFPEIIHINLQGAPGYCWFRIKKINGQNVPEGIAAKSALIRILDLALVNTSEFGKDRGKKLVLYTQMNKGFVAFESGDPFPDLMKPDKLPGNAFSKGLIGIIREMTPEQLRGKLWLIPSVPEGQNSQGGKSLLCNMMTEGREPIFSAWKRDIQIDWEEWLEEAIAKVEYYCGGLPKQNRPKSTEVEDSEPQPKRRLAPAPAPAPVRAATPEPEPEPEPEPQQAGINGLEGTLTSMDAFQPYKDTRFVTFTVWDEIEGKQKCFAFDPLATELKKLPLESTIAVTGEMKKDKQGEFVFKVEDFSILETPAPESSQPVDEGWLISEVQAHFIRLRWDRAKKQQKLKAYGFQYGTDRMNHSELEMLLELLMVEEPETDEVPV